ncbi:MAG: metal-dependent hydrolase [Gammaproteobacteria bacterium]|nr:metal-dependent hydrolase [Gammaproteobacteria bacterium]
MDIVTQGLLGGVLAQSVAHRHEKRIASVVGVVAGLLADADVLIGSASDPLLNIEYHRHFTHSLVFIPIGAAIAALLLWPFLRRSVTPSRLYVFSLAGYSMSGMLDALTSYGTHLFWPFTDDRLSLNIISIVDPVFTLILMIGLVLGFWRRSQAMVLTAIVLCVTYLGLAWIQHQRADTLAMQLAQSRGHQPEQSLVKPTLANLLLWRSVYIESDRIYVDAVRPGMFSGARIYEGESVPLFQGPVELESLAPGTVLYRDIQRFVEFSDGYVAFDPNQPNVLGDIRYSMLPVSARPLWGIVVDIGEPKQHVDYRFFRESNAHERQVFLDMVLGR